MEERKYKNLIKNFQNSINDTKKVIKSAVDTEFADYGHKIDLEYIKNILNSSDNVLENSNLKNKKISVLYDGNPEIGIELILAALKNDFKLTLCAEKYDVINNCLITLLLECMKELNLKNEYIDYEEKYDETYFIENSKYFDKLIYIGEYFEYTKVKYFIKNEVEFFCYGTIKLYIDSEEYKDIYKTMLKYCFMRNIAIDVYSDIEDLIEEVSDQDFVVVYLSKNDDKKLIKQRLKSVETVLYNEFTYDEYRFKINDLLVKL